MIRLVLFDIDGTLVHTGGAGMKAFSQVFATEFNVPNGSEKIKFAGRTDYSLVREFFVWNQIEPTPYCSVGEMKACVESPIPQK